MRAVLYDVKWQLLRISFLAARRTDGGWSTEEGQRKNLFLLQDYLEQPCFDTDCRLFRVNNCLNAVVMGYNGQKLLELIPAVQQFRNKFAPSSKYNDIVVTAASATWDWEKVKQDLLTVPTGGAYSFLRTDLGKRAQRGSERTRPELHIFIKCMDEVWPLWVEQRRSSKKVS